MIRRVIVRELLDHLLSYRFLALSAFGAVLIWLSMWSGYTYYSEQVREHRRAIAATEARIREIDDSENYSEFVAGGFLVHKPPSALSAFVRGQDPYLGRSISMRTGVNRMSRSTGEANPLKVTYDLLDLDTVFRIVLSLFALLLTFDAVCGEKQAGTLRLALSYPTKRRQYLAGKLLGALLPLEAGFGLPLVLGIGVMLFLPGIHLETMELTRLGLIVCAMLLYLAVFVCAGILGSVLFSKPSTSFAVLLVFWVGILVIVPRLSLIAASAILPAPSAYELAAEKESIQLGATQAWRKSRGDWWGEHVASRGEAWVRSPEGQEAFRLHYRQAREDVLFQTMATGFRRLEEDFQNRYRARLDLADMLATLSPGYTLSHTAVALSGTGLDRQSRFVRVYDEYYLHWRGWFVDEVDDQALQRINPTKFPDYKWDLSPMPRMQYTEVWPEEELADVGTDLCILLAWCAVFLVAAASAIQRFDVR